RADTTRGGLRRTRARGNLPIPENSDEGPVGRHPTGGRDALDVGHLLGRPTFLVVLPEPPENRVVGGEEPFDLCAAIVAGIRVCPRSFPRWVASGSIVFRGPSRQPIGMRRRPRVAGSLRPAGDSAAVLVAGAASIAAGNQIAGSGARWR